MKELIKELVSKYNAVSLKLDLASEAITKEEILAYSNFAKEIKLPLTTKIGGCDAITDIYIAKNIDTDTILAPMIESPYALKKFVNNCKEIYENDFEKITLYINIETMTAYNVIDNILNTNEMEYISGIVLGRDDMAKSNNISMKDINSPQMFEIAQTIANKTFLHNKNFIIGGQIRPDATKFLNSIPSEKLSGYETRRIAFSHKNLNQISESAITKAIEFEIKWLNYVKVTLNKNIVESRIENLKRSIYGLCY